MKDKYIGERVGIFDIKEETPYKTKDGHKLYRGVCVICGIDKISRVQTFKEIKICTHLGIDSNPKVISVGWDNKRLENIFKGIKSRCYNPNNKSYKWYGAKGIGVYKEWMLNPKTFENWAIHNGYNDDLTIDRIDESKGYEPTNCRWVTHKSNARYKSTTKIIKVDGIELTGRGWSEYLQIGTNVINTYIRQYGLENTKEFIRKYKNNKELRKNRKPNQSYYDLYMNNNLS